VPEQYSSSRGFLSRRDFLKLLGAGGAGIAFAPFVTFGNYMPNPSQTSLEKVKVMLPDGTQANLKTFPINSSEVVTYPSTGDPALDAEAFRKWQFIRLPEELGGAKNDVSAFRVYSMVCLHLWCLWSYVPTKDPVKPHNKGECPCHGSMYDPTTGIAVQGPASNQSPPSNTLPKIELESDENGFLYITPPTWDVNENGVIGYGRFVKS
jgi:Rieske Fe-S protein